jgi:acid phosphatase
VKHNPWVYFADEHAACSVGDVSSGTPTSGHLATDIANGSLPNAGLVIPDLCNDGHDCSLTTADSWLKGWLPKILAGPDFTSGRLAVVITADEDDRNSGNVVLTTMLQASLAGAHKVVSTPLSHYSLSRLYSQVTGTPSLRHASTAPDMRAAFGLR